MNFSEIYGPAPTVGLEYEVAIWQPEKSRYTAAANLGQAGYLLEGNSFNNYRPYTAMIHDYHCQCPRCLQTERINYPPLWKMQKDASLPEEGAEYISSPFPAASIYIEEAVRAIELIQMDAAPLTKPMSNLRNTGPAQTGFHIHVKPYTDQELVADLKLLINVLNSFCPEMFMIAELGVIKPRKMTFRLPVTYFDIPGGPREQHHAWLSYVDKHPARLEFRLWETPFNDLDYYRRAIIFTAGLSQLALDTKMAKKLWAFGLEDSWVEECSVSPGRLLQLNDVLNCFSLERFTRLCEMIVQFTSIGEDDEAIDIIRKTEARVNTAITKRRNRVLK